MGDVLPSIPAVLDGYPVTSIGRRAFYDCSWLKDIKIPDSVTEIDDEAFSGCSGLFLSSIPALVTDIGEEAFFGCENLTITVVRGSYADQYFQKNYWSRINYID